MLDRVGDTYCMMRKVVAVADDIWRSIAGCDSPKKLGELIRASLQHQDVDAWLRYWTANLHEFTDLYRVVASYAPRGGGSEVSWEQLLPQLGERNLDKLRIAGRHLEQALNKMAPFAVLEDETLRAFDQITAGQARTGVLLHTAALSSLFVGTMEDRISADFAQVCVSIIEDASLMVRQAVERGSLLRDMKPGQHTILETVINADAYGVGYFGHVPRLQLETYGDTPEAALEMLEHMLRSYLSAERARSPIHLAEALSHLGISAGADRVFFLVPVQAEVDLNLDSPLLLAIDL